MMQICTQWNGRGVWRSGEKKVTVDDVGDEYVERIHMALECHDVNAALA